MSEKKLNLNQKLIEIQKELKAPKSQFNSYGKYNYRSCEDILEAVKPLTTSRGLALILYDKIVNVGDRYYVEGHAKLIDAETGEFVDVPALSRESETKKGMDDSQVTGTASSYARKYALNGLFCIDDSKDADTDAYRNQQNNAPSNQQPKQKQVQQPQQQEQQFVCADCGTPFKPCAVKLKDGSAKYMTAEDVYKLSKSKNADGVARCSACMAKNNNQRG